MPKLEIYFVSTTSLAIHTRMQNWINHTHQSLLFAYVIYGWALIQTVASLFRSLFIRCYSASFAPMHNKLNNYILNRHFFYSFFYYFTELLPKYLHDWDSFLRVRRAKAMITWEEDWSLCTEDEDALRQSSFLSCWSSMLEQSSSCYSFGWLRWSHSKHSLKLACSLRLISFDSCLWGALVVVWP